MHLDAFQLSVGNRLSSLDVQLSARNVHFRHTARLINALIAAQKPYQLLLFPNDAWNSSTSTLLTTPLCAGF